MTLPLHIAVLGQADEGRALARALAEAGASVIGFDVRPPAEPVVPLAASLAEALASAEVVFSMSSANAALRIVEQAASQLAPGALFVDLNEATPSLKRTLAERLPEGVLVDGAMSAATTSVAPFRLALAGPAANRLAETLAPLGLELEMVSEVVGDAAARHLLSTMLSKSLAGVAVDFMWTAQAMGLEEWAYRELLRAFDGHSAETAKRLLSETVANPKRREIEMLDIVELLESAGHHSLFVPPTQLVYNKVYHSIKVPFGTPAEQAKAEQSGQPAADW